MYKKIIWNTILLVSIISAIVFSASVIISAKITNGSNIKNEEATTQDTETNNENKSAFTGSGDSYNILVLGDSLAKGTGDETGKGFAQEFAGLWSTQTSRKVEVNNMAVNGDISSGLLKIVEEKETLKAIESSNLIFISIGGNEVKAFRNDKNEASLTEIKNVQDNYINNLKEVMDLIASKNKNCRVIFIGLYNPFGENLGQNNLKILYDWNYKTEQLLLSYSDIVFMPTYDLFKYNLNDYLAQDNFHPNSKGYKAIANRILEVLK